jgi:molecular chaperone HtpG
MSEKTETRQFQAEVQQILNLMINALYSNREIFLRELISNGADACDKLRFESLKDSSLNEDDPNPRIRVSFDEKARTVTVADNGIGMSRDEVIENIGTIARSGTRRFVENLTGDQKKDAALIGQFGVGFYSSFIVADNVMLRTRRAGLDASEGVEWSSDGSGEYTLSTIERPERGTEVTLHLREGQDEFLSEWRLKEIIQRYSDHIGFPIQMPARAEEGEASHWETVNQAAALWTRPKRELSDEDYQAFYKHVAHDDDDPLAWSHHHVEGKQSYRMLLYLPSRAPMEMMWNRDERRGLRLYVKRVFIMDAAEHLLPGYLRFVRGVVDSDDLPLNISREILQQNDLVAKIRSACVKRTLDLLDQLADKEPEKYRKFWKAFGNVLKEGLAEDFSNRERIARLLRFASTEHDSDEQTVSLDDYLKRMKANQDTIYYITADGYNAAKNSPHLEVFRKQGIEVLLLYDRVDEWMMAHLDEYQGKRFQSIAKGELDLGGDEEKEVVEDKGESAHKDLFERVGKALDGRVKSVRASKRLTDSASCLVLEEEQMAVHLQKLLKQAGHEVPDVQPILEVNPSHPLVRRLEGEADDARFEELATLLFEQAYLSEGGQLEDPAGFVRRMNRLFVTRDDTADSA